MLQVVESISNLFVRFPIKPGEDIREGSICQIDYADSGIFCKLSDGTRPFGFVGNVLPNGLVPVWYERMIVRTDAVDVSFNPDLERPLYVSERGMLTNTRRENCPKVGFWISDYRKEKGYIELLWI